MDPDLSPKTSKKGPYSDKDSGLSQEPQEGSKTPGSSVGSSNVGRGISAFFESLPELETELMGLSGASEDDSKTPVFEANLGPSFSGTREPTDLSKLDLRSSRRAIFTPRSKSSLRLRYDAEVLLIKRKIGDLEFIRQSLGLTQRKMCQLLLVDPSAWTRWTKKGEDAPPHIYRALQWYLAIQEKYPALDVNFWLSTVAKVDDAGARRQEEKIATLGGEFANLTSEIKRLQEELSSRTEEFSSRVREMQMQLEQNSLDHVGKDPLATIIKRLSRNPKLFLAMFAGALLLGFLLAAVFLK